MPSLISRIQNGWNAFMNKDPTFDRYSFGEQTSYARPDRTYLSFGNDRSLVSSVYNRIAVDYSNCDIRHVQLDEQERYVDTIDSGLNECLSVSANIDQTGRAFVQDCFMSLLDEGNIAIVPVDTDSDPNNGLAFEIYSMRVGKIIEWRPSSVKLQVYNERTGKRQEIVMRKSSVAIVENPFYSIMNEPNSLAKRIARKLALLDYVDEQNGAGKIDLIVKLPYSLKSPARIAMAEDRRKDIEMQLQNSKYGIAYVDATEGITQLNRSVDNQLLPQIKELKEWFYSQLGITDEILNGTATVETFNNYYQRTIVPLLTAYVESMRRVFLTKTARTQHKSIVFFNNPFKLIPANQLAELGDKLIRNEIMTANEVRQAIGIKPAQDPRADELRNPNISEAKDARHINTDGEEMNEIYREE